jgi:hypothetical protein
MADGIAPLNGPGPNPGGQVGQQQAAPPEEQNIRVHRTHINPEVVAMLSNLSLFNKLETNKNIELTNISRMKKTLEHTIDPTNHPVAGSDTASLITISDEEISDLLDDNIRSYYKDVIPVSVAKRLAAIQKTISGESQSSKRPAATDSVEKAIEARLAKRRCMTGDDIAPRVVGTPSLLIFPQIMFDTEDCVSIPLPFFLHKNLRYIIDNAAMLDTVKSNPLVGTTKGLQILDIAKLSNKLGSELSLTCSQWGEAGWQMYRFQQERDKAGPDGSFAGWYSNHFNFFSSQIDKEETYDAWKSLELELHQEFRSQKKDYSAAHHAERYLISKSEHLIWTWTQAAIQAMSRSSGQGQFPPRSGGSNGRFSRPGNSFTSSQTPPTPSSSFPSSSTKSALSACCILCGRRGHTVIFHANDTTPQKSADGKPTFCKYASDRILRSPDNKEVCIPFNIKGERAACSHSKEERAHICSFCGKIHFAFAWVCRSRPSES